MTFRPFETPSYRRENRLVQFPEGWRHRSEGRYGRLETGNAWISKRQRTLSGPREGVLYADSRTSQALCGGNRSDVGKGRLSRTRSKTRAIRARSRSS